MKQVNYSDGAPSREWEDDDERENTGPSTGCITQTRDELNVVIPIIQMCEIALTHPEWKGQEYLEKQVSFVLAAYVVPELSRIEKKLGNL